MKKESIKNLLKGLVAVVIAGVLYFGGAWMENNCYINELKDRVENMSIDELVDRYMVEEANDGDGFGDNGYAVITEIDMVFNRVDFDVFDKDTNKKLGGVNIPIDMLKNDVFNDMY